MQFQYYFTRLNVENFQACKAFYRDVLGLSLRLEDDKDEYAEFDTGSTCLTLFNRAKLTDYVTREEDLNYDRHSARIVLSFRVKSMEEAVKYLKGHGIKLLNPPTQYPEQGFVSTCFRDPDGNLIEIEQMTDVLVM